MFFLFQVLKNECCQILYDVNENSRKKRKINRRQLIVLNFEGRKNKSIMKKPEILSDNYSLVRMEKT